MAQIERIRFLLHVKGLSERQVARELGISRRTVAKYRDCTTPPAYTRTRPRPAPILTPEYKAEIERLLEENKHLPRKQRWIGHTIFLRLKELGYQRAEPTVRRYIGVVRRQQRRPEAYVPLEFEPGEVAEFDWGQVQVVVAGRPVTAHLFCYRLRWSHMPFVAAYPHQQQEIMFDGLRRAFETLGGTPERLTSDNLAQAVQKILDGKNRRERDAYLAFRTHYLIQSNFCNPGAGHEKGSVENLVGFAQRNIVGPRLEAESWEALQAILWERYLEYARRTFRGESETVLERWQREQARLRPLPRVPFDCCKVLPVRASKVALVQYDTCRYSVPSRYAGQELTLRAYWDRVEVYCGLKRIAVHARCYERGRDVLDLDHYLDLLGAKPGALGAARPFRAAQLPAVYHQFRAELNRRHPHGDREFIEVLKLHREFPSEAVQAALEQALAQRTVQVQAVRQILLATQASSQPVAALPAAPADIRVQQPPLAQYDRLLAGGVVR